MTDLTGPYWNLAGTFQVRGEAIVSFPSTKYLVLGVDVDNDSFLSNRVGYCYPWLDLSLSSTNYARVRLKSHIVYRDSTLLAFETKTHGCKFVSVPWLVSTQITLSVWYWSHTEEIVVYTP
jgi:hypothetical protein